MTGNSVTHVSFKQLIKENSDRLPLVFEVQEGCYGKALDGPRDFSTGEIFRLESIDHVVNVTFSDAYSVSSERGLITLPLDFKGLFRPVPVWVSRGEGRPINKSLKTTEEIASDLPCIAYPTHDITTSSTTIPKGTKMEFTRTVQFTPHENVFILCNCHLPNITKNILLGIKTNDMFELPEKLYTLKELLHRMPIRVYHVTETPESKSQEIPGLPDNFDDPVFLSKVDVVSCRPVVDTSEVVRIPVDTELTVKQINLSDDHFNPTKNIQDLIKHEVSFPVCVEVVDFNDKLKISSILRDLQSEQLLIVEAVNEVEKILTKGKERYFTVPTENYKGRFKMIPKTFQTADEIWQEHYTKKVRVTENYIVSKPQMDSIFAGDVLTFNEIQVVSLQRDECEVIVCSRESAVPERSATVRVPSYATAGFEAVDCPQDMFSLSRIPSELPFRARLHGTPHQRKHNEDDQLLLDEGPLNFEVCFSETDILVSIFDESKKTTTHQFFIPENKHVRVKRRNMPTDYEPRADAKERLMIDLLSETEYKSMCATHQEYEDAPPIAPPIPPRPKKKGQRTSTSSLHCSSDSDDDGYYDKPEDVRKVVQRSPSRTGTYVHSVPKAMLKSGFNTLKKKFGKRKQNDCNKGASGSPDDQDYEAIDSHDYLQPVQFLSDPGVALLQQKLADIDVNTEVIQKVHELKLTEKDFVCMLKSSSEKELMHKLRLKKVEIIALRSTWT